jgi:hypothetical protein
MINRLMFLINWIVFLWGGFMVLSIMYQLFFIGLDSFTSGNFYRWYDYILLIFGPFLACYSIDYITTGQVPRYPWERDK